MNKNDLLPGTRWRNAVHVSHQTLRVQELRTICDPARTNGTKRQAETEHGIEGRRTGKEEKRIPQMVSEQEIMNPDAAFETENQQMS